MIEIESKHVTCAYFFTSILPIPTSFSIPDTKYVVKEAARSGRYQQYTQARLNYYLEAVMSLIYHRILCVYRLEGKSFS